MFDVRQCTVEESELDGLFFTDLDLLLLVVIIIIESRAFDCLLVG